MSRFRLVPRIEQSGTLRVAVTTVPGKLVLLFITWLMLQAHGVPVPRAVALALVPITLFPRWRRPLLLVATLGFWLIGFNWLDWRLVDHSLAIAGLNLNLAIGMERAVPIAIAMLLCAAVVHLFTRSRWADKVGMPFYWLLAFYVGLVGIFSTGWLSESARAIFWAVSVPFGGMIWFLGYTLIERKKPGLPGFWGQVGHYIPFWAHDSEIPMGKGASYLQRIEAKTPEALAISHLKGIKLIYWALLLHILHTALTGILYGRGSMGDLVLLRNNADLLFYWRGELYIRFGGIPDWLWMPRFRAAFDACMRGACYGWLINWQALISFFFDDLLRAAIWMHVTIGTLRIAGFNALRGMRNPLAASSIADFWNRVDYYFKEMLVHLFYFPVFFRYLRRWRYLRMFASVFAAVFIGNSLLHFLMYQRVIMERGIWAALQGFHGYAIYAFILANGIFFSQWLLDRHSPLRGYLQHRILAPLRVSTFYCLILVFAYTRMDSNIVDNLRFFCSLFGISL